MTAKTGRSTIFFQWEKSQGPEGRSGIWRGGGWTGHTGPRDPNGQFRGHRI